MERVYSYNPEARMGHSGWFSVDYTVTQKQHLLYTFLGVAS